MTRFSSLMVVTSCSSVSLFTVTPFAGDASSNVPRLLPLPSSSARRAKSEMLRAPPLRVELCRIWYSCSDNLKLTSRLLFRSMAIVVSWCRDKCCPPAESLTERLSDVVATGGLLRYTSSERRSSPLVIQFLCSGQKSVSMCLSFCQWFTQDSDDNPERGFVIFCLRT